MEAKQTLLVTTVSTNAVFIGAKPGAAAPLRGTGPHFYQRALKKSDLVQNELVQILSLKSKHKQINSIIL